MPPEDNHDRLLADLFHDAWETGALAQTAQRAARRVRRRRRARQVAFGGSAVAACALAWFARPSSPREVPDVVSAQTEFVATSTPPAQRPLEIISDDELLALLGNESVLIVREQGRVHRVLFLQSLRD